MDHVQTGTAVRVQLGSAVPTFLVVRALYETVRGEPFIKMPLKKQSYGDWEFEVRDPNGYILVFGGDAHIGADDAA